MAQTDSYQFELPTWPFAISNFNLSLRLLSSFFFSTRLLPLLFIFFFSFFFVGSPLTTHTNDAECPLTSLCGQQSCQGCRCSTLKLITTNGQVSLLASRSQRCHSTCRTILNIYVFIYTVWGYVRISGTWHCCCQAIRQLTVPQTCLWLALEQSNYSYNVQNLQK